MKLGPVTRADAIKLDATFVRAVEADDATLIPFCLDVRTDLKKGMTCLYHGSISGPRGFMVVRITSFQQTYEVPTVRVTNGEGSWRIEGAIAPLTK